MNRIKCECGHVNPEGTVLCEACGKPIDEKEYNSGGLANMRYDGSARRSQVYQTSIVDRVWAFFSSVKVGIWLIVLTLVASAIGTLLPQEMYIPAEAVSRDPSIFYEDRYGLPGKIYYQLGFHNLYSSWWYITLVALIGISLVICSLDRVVPLYRALKKQKPKRHEMFLRKQRLFSVTEGIEHKAELTDNLRKQRYRIREEDGHIAAEKGRFSRWGPYINHIGLIIILLASILRFTPLMYKDAAVSVREGERIVIPGTDGAYYIENEKFILETYGEKDEKFKDAIEKRGDVAKNYQTNAVIYKTKEGAVPGEDPKLEQYKSGEIRMNQPLKFDGYALYQRNYQLNEFKDMTFKLVPKDNRDAKPVDSFKVDLTSPEKEYKLKDGYKVQLTQFYPDYFLNEDKEGGPQPDSKSPYPRNPAFVFSVYEKDAKNPEVSFAGIGQNIDASGKNKYKLAIADFTTRNVSGLTVRRDYTLPFYIIGAAIFMIGVIQGMYWQHRRVWIHPTDDGKLLLAAHTNKNWFSLQRDIERAIGNLPINSPEDQQELDKERDRESGENE
ncbi:cytochrome c biogenesis protein ResB [Aciduricibacillus chroicocephali]|uniref:Cytochrome c biogenesis protein ResB n=1 Tax=Aciduricibacillus chroicocephali TaxID=3054939 RepID=A0ABY9KRV0_9BACI|nr:cytochrome c biogenesis protein ResB [Bacillaceae bacterium 44XB]